ncbi:MAG: oligosaccharide flippase family protein [Metallosphaera sp.]|uniref:oligosaccharide flippase family protein n=1 Tax=Metallosphaera sp. TaxID=2020860 RepID=UPI003166F381
MNPIINYLKSLSVTAVNIFVAFVFFIFTAKITEPAFFGEIAIIQLLEAMTSFYAILNTGIITREVSYMYAHNNIERRFLSTVFITPFLVSPFFLILLIFPNYVKLAIPYLILYLFFTFASSVLMGLNKFTENSIINIIFLIIRWGVSLIAVVYHDIYLFILIWTLGGLLASLSSFLIVYNHVKGLPLVFDHIIFKKVFKEGFPFYLSNFSNFLSSQGDRVTTAYLLGSAYLGIYQFSALLSGVPSMIIGAANSALLTSSSYYRAKGKDEVKMSKMAFKTTAIMSLIVSILSLPIAYYLVSTLFPDYKSGLPVITILLLAITLSTPMNILSRLIIAFKRNLRPFIFLSIITGLTVVITSFILIPRLGILGGAISQLLSSIISSSFILWYSLYTQVFTLGKKELVVLSIIPLVFIYEVFLDPLPYPLLFDSVLLLFLILLFKKIKLLENDEKEIMFSFLNNKLNFIKVLIKLML